MSETLKEVLKDKELVLLFREFLHECNSAENLAFWLEVEEYKKSPENELQARANEIWDKYFNPKSNYELNVEGKLKSGLEQNLKNPTPNLFDGPQQAIWKVMEHDSFPKFVQTQRWKQFKDGNVVLKHQDELDDLTRARSRSSTIWMVESYFNN